MSDGFEKHSNEDGRQAAKVPLPPLRIDPNRSVQMGKAVECYRKHINSLGPVSVVTMHDELVGIQKQEIASLRDRLAKAEAELERTKFERRLAVASIAEELDRAVAECRAGRRARDLAAECLNDSAGCSVCGDSNALYEAAIAANPLPEAPRA